MLRKNKNLLRVSPVLFGTLFWGLAATAATPVPNNAIPFAPAHLANIQVPSAPNAWGGPRTAKDKTLSDRITTYAIQASLDPDKHTVSAHEHMTWRNRSNLPIHAVYFHMYLNAFEGPGSTFFTERDTFGSSGSRGAAKLKKGQWGYVDLDKVQEDGAPVTWKFVHPDGGPDTDHTVVEFDLPKAVPPHGTLALDIDFHDKLPRVVERTGWFGKFHLVAQWFPKIAVLELPGERGATQVRWNAHEFHFHSEFFADYGNYDMHLTVPKDYTVVAVGQQQGDPVAKDGQDTYHFVQDDVEDFAWMAAPGYKVAQTTWTFPGSPNVTVKVAYPAEYEACAQPVLKATTDSLTYFSKTLGAYPYATVTAVVPPYNATEAGGMEYPTFFTTEGMPKVTPGTISQYIIDFVTIHEFGHGYFMGILGSNEFEEPMLDEGMNEYWDDHMLRARGQDIHVTTPFYRWLGIAPSMSPFVMERLSGAVSVGQPGDSLDSNSWDRLSNLSYGSVYSRTVTTMHDLEQEVGQPAMERAMKLYYDRWKFRHPSAADLEQALEDGTGQPKVVARIFDQQVYGTDKVDDRVSKIDSWELVPQAGTEVRDGKRVVITSKDVRKEIAKARKDWKAKHKKAKPGTGPYLWHSIVTVRRDGAPVPETLLVKFEDGSSKTVQWNDDARWHRYIWDAPSKAVSAELDPQHDVLLDDNKLNDSYSAKANGAAARRWSSDAAALLENIYAMVVSL